MRKSADDDWIVIIIVEKGKGARMILSSKKESEF